MSKFIVLTDQYGDKVSINSDNIVSINDDKVNEKIIGSRLNLLDRYSICVKEKLGQILYKIKGEE